MANQIVVVTGAGGFIGGHLVSRLLETGTVRVRAVDVKPFSQWHQVFDAAENLELDLSRASKTDELHDTVNYAGVYESTLKIVAERSYALIERLASAILDEIFRDPRIVRGTVTIAKPDLLDGATPSVSLSREHRAR